MVAVVTKMHNVNKAMHECLRYQYKWPSGLSGLGPSKMSRDITKINHVW